MKTRPLTGGIMPITPRIFFEGEGEGGGGGGEGDAAAKAAEAEKAAADADKVKEEVMKPKNLAEFNARFAAKDKTALAGAPPTQEEIDAVKRNSEQLARQKGTIVDDDDIPPDETPEQKAWRERNSHRPGGNKPKILLDKRAAEAERDKIKTEYETYKTTTEAKIAELQGKIDGGKLSDAKEAEYTKKISDLEASIATEKEELTKRNTELQSKLSLYDIQEDPMFRKEYVEPVKTSFQAAIEAIGNDDKANDLLNQALMANAASLRASSVEAKRVAERQRDNILSQIEESLPSFTGNRFSAAMGDYIMATQKHARALANHEITAKDIREKAIEESQRSYAKTLESWGKTYEAQEKAHDEELSLTKEEIEAAKELGIDLDKELKDNKVMAKKSATGEAKMVDSIRLLHQGRLAPAYKARIKLQQAKIANLETLVAKLRGSSTRGGDAGSSGKDAEKKPNSREEWQQSKFGANRPGLQRQ